MQKKVTVEKKHDNIANKTTKILLFTFHLCLVMFGYESIALSTVSTVTRL